MLILRNSKDRGREVLMSSLMRRDKAQMLDLNVYSSVC